MLDFIFAVIVRLYAIIIWIFAVIVYGVVLYANFGYLLLICVVSGQVSPTDFDTPSKLAVIGWFAITFGLPYLLFF